MEMNVETRSMVESFGESVERLSIAASLLERAVARLEQSEQADATAMSIVATVDGDGGRGREQELQRRLQEAEQQIAELKAQASRASASRKTIPATTTQLLAKQGITSLDSVEAGALDAALTGLSLEQRIAVKSQLMRAGSLV